MEYLRHIFPISGKKATIFSLSSREVANHRNFDCNEQGNVSKVGACLLAPYLLPYSTSFPGINTHTGFPHKSIALVCLKNCFCVFKLQHRCCISDLAVEIGAVGLLIITTLTIDLFPFTSLTPLIQGFFLNSAGKIDS